MTEPTDQLREASFGAYRSGSLIALSIWAQGLGSREVWISPVEARQLANQLNELAGSNSYRVVKDEPQA